jgi:saccharopine dehydrogenase (NADP+, L-glutamate forming)/spermidine synthase
VCTAGTNPGRYREDGREVNVPGPELFAHRHRVVVEGLGELEAYPNRDSLGYIDLYGLSGIETMFRGTFRYPGWCETLKKIVDLGLLDETPATYPARTTFAQFVGGFLRSAGTGDLRADLAGQLELEPRSVILDRFEWLGLLSDDPLPMTEAQTTPLDILAARLLEKMPYRPGERDMIVLCHTFTGRFPSGADEEITSTLIEYGRPNGDSAMARTVSLPAAVGAKLLLTGVIDRPGVHIPVSPDIYNPVLDELAEMGIRCVERTKPLDGGGAP